MTHRWTSATDVPEPLVIAAQERRDRLRRSTQALGYRSRSVSQSNRHVGPAIRAVRAMPRRSSVSCARDAGDWSPAGGERAGGGLFRLLIRRPLLSLQHRPDYCSVGQRSS